MIFRSCRVSDRASHDCGDHWRSAQANDMVVNKPNARIGCDPIIWRADVAQVCVTAARDGKIETHRSWPERGKTMDRSTQEMDH